MERFSRWLTPVIALFFATAVGVTASTTIGTDILTEGALTVEGSTTLDTLTASTTAAGSDITLSAMDALNLTSVGQLTMQTSDWFQVDLLGGATFYMETENGDYLSFYEDRLLEGYVSNGSYSTEVDCRASSCEMNMNGDGHFLGLNLSGTNTEFNFNASGSGSAVTLYGQGQVTLDSGGAVYSKDPFGIPAQATLPVCNTTIAPAGYYALYFDTTGPDLCFCNGTSWAPVDGVGTCA